MHSDDVVLLIWAGSAVLSYMAAMARHRDPVCWMAVALVAGPLAPFALICLVRPGPDPALSLDREAWELCDACLEPVRRDRQACRYCGAAS